MSSRISILTTAFTLFCLVPCVSLEAFQATWERAKKSGSVEGYTEWLDSTVDEVARFHNQFHPSKGRGIPVDFQVSAYKQLASKMDVPKEVDLLEFPLPESSAEEWVDDAKKAANAIKPEMNYQVDNASGFKVIQGTSEAEKNLKDNIKVIAWYRDQIEEVCPEKHESEGAYALAEVIDEYLAELADSVPPVRVKLTGRMNMPKDKKLEYSDKKLWEMMSTVNRYFYYKVQVHDDKKEALPADYLLMGAMVKTAALYGAAPPPKSLIEIDARLTKENKGWKGAAYDAIKSWEKEINGEFDTPQKACVIKIPEIPKPQPAPQKPKKKDEFPSDVEDVKEIGGKIFIKRKGYWSLWEKK